MEQEDQQEAAASLTVAGKFKKRKRKRKRSASCMIGTWYKSICLVKSAFTIQCRPRYVYNTMYEEGPFL